MPPNGGVRPHEPTGGIPTLLLHSLAKAELFQRALPKFYLTLCLVGMGREGDVGCFSVGTFSSVFFNCIFVFMSELL